MRCLGNHVLIPKQSSVNSAFALFFGGISSAEKLGLE
jgi:hypothetical protein